MSGLPLTFAAPLVLTALAALPIIWLLLRVTPPSPRRIAFPPLKLFADIASRREIPARTPWWLLLLRLLTCAALILACAGPLWNPPAPLPGKGPLLMLVDNGFTAAHDWRERANALEETMREALRANRTVALVALAAEPQAITAMGQDPALAALHALKPQPHLATRTAHLEHIRAFLKATPDAALFWLTDEVSGDAADTFGSRLSAITQSRDITLMRRNQPDVLALKPADMAAAVLEVRAIRADPNKARDAMVRALGQNGQPIAEMPLRFAPGQTEANVSFDIPAEIRNGITRVEITAERSAGAVVLLDETAQRRSVGLVAGTTFDQAQPLLSPLHYLQRGLQPFADIRLDKGGDTATIGALIDGRIDALILADTGALDGETTKKLTDYVENGGLLIRFAGSRLASADGALLPVPLRRGDRDLGAALSWTEPKKLAAFTKEGPFFGLPIPSDIVVTRQVLADPNATLPERTWATLQDGTPLVTAVRRGKGAIVLFHVTATPTWSNLPLSGLFIDMLRRTIQTGRGSAARGESKAETTLPPRLVLDGYGDLAQPTATAQPLPSGFTGHADASHPPGFYGPAEGGFAVNALTAQDTLHTLAIDLPGDKTLPLRHSGAIDLRIPLFVTALLLFMADSLAMLWLGGHGSWLRRRGKAAALAIAVLTLFSLSPTDATAQTRDVEQSALEPRLAYIATGDASIDTVTREGLRGLSQFLVMNTSFEPGEPIAVDPDKDELAFYPLIYWPIATAQSPPSDKAIRALNTFMKNGGTILFDTRDAFEARPGLAATPQALALRALLSRLDVPQLEPVPHDHVLTKTFYLLDSFPGRYDTSPLWTEVSTARATDDDSGPVRVGDGVSPVLVTGNDFAGAWAIGARGETLLPTSGSDPRQRTMAYRTGVNIVLYTLTGNYKSDQVHVEEILKRLGREGGR